jgi:hypothetical protein
MTLGRDVKMGLGIERKNERNKKVEEITEGDEESRMRLRMRERDMKR